MVATDLNGCEIAVEVDIIEPENQITISSIQSDYSGYGVSCHGQTDGFIDITVIGGTENYTTHGQMVKHQKTYLK